VERNITVTLTGVFLDCVVTVIFFTIYARYYPHLIITSRPESRYPAYVANVASLKLGL